MALSVRQQQALTALIEQPTREAAARAAGVSSRTLRTYLQDPEFKRAYSDATAALVAEATKRLQSAAGSAVATLEGIASDDEAADSVRVTAARAILDTTLKFTELNDVLRELRELEGGA